MKFKLLHHMMFCLLIAGFAFTKAETPSIVLQGALRDQMNRPAPEGEYAMTFAIYTQKTGGTALWTSPQQMVMVSNGTFTAALKGFGPEVSFTDQYFVGITVAGMGTEMQPRIELTAAPYTLSISGTENKFSGDGNTGIGTVDPTERLEVNGNVKVSGYLESGDGLSSNSNLRFKQGSGGLYDSFDKSLLQLSSSQTLGEVLTFRPGGSTNSAFNFQLNDIKGFQTDNNTPLFINNSDWRAGIKFFSGLNDALSGEGFNISRGGDLGSKNQLALTIDDYPNSNLKVTSGENNNALVTINGLTGGMGIGAVPDDVSKLNIGGSLYVNGVLPFEYKEFQAYGNTIEINTNYDADKWVGVFAGFNPNGFDVHEYPGSGFFFYCFTRNGKIYVRARIPGHIYDPLHRVFVLFIRRELVSGVNPAQ